MPRCPTDVEVEIGWVHSADLEKDKGWDIVKQADAILVPGGFGSRGIEGKILAARYARENKVPYLGLCLGMQVMCIDFARQCAWSLRMPTRPNLIAAQNTLL